MINYVSLHNHTSFSIMNALIKPIDLFQKAKELGQTAIAVTDCGTLAGAWDALKASEKIGVKLIIGCEFYFVDDVQQQDAQMRHVVLLAKNHTGYKNLLKLSKLGYDNFIVMFKKAVARIDWKLLEEHKDGLICLTGCGNGILGQTIMKKNYDLAKEHAQKLKDIFGDDLAIELQPHALVRRESAYSFEVDQRFVNKQLAQISEELDIRPIVATDVRYLNKKDHRALDVLSAIGSGQPIYSGNRLTFNVSDFYVKSAIEVASFFIRFKNTWSPEFIQKLFDNTIYFADKCEQPKWIDPKFSNPSGKELPIFPVKDQEDYDVFKKYAKEKGWENLADDVAYLRYKCDLTFDQKVPADKKEEYRERLKEEFDVIEYHGFSSYMLIVFDYIEFARKNNIRVGPGRGCNFFETKVLTKNGFKNLGEIEKNEQVFTHNGKLQNVINTFKFDTKNEKCLKFKTENAYKELVMTKDHKVFGVQYRETDEYKKALTKFKGKCKKYRKIIEKPYWIRAENLRVGDWIFTRFPIRRSTVVPRKIDLSRFIDFQYIDTRVTKKYIIYNDNKIKRYIYFDNSFYYFLGRFIGDGWFSSKDKNYYTATLGIAFHIDDKIGQNKICEFLVRNGYSYRFQYIKDSPNVCQIIVTNKILVSFMRYLFPNYKQKADTKYIPYLFRYSTLSSLRYLLLGLSDADGSVEGTRECIDTTSLELAFQIKEILLYLKIPSTINIRLPYDTIIKGKKYHCKESYKIRFRGLKTVPNNKFIRKNGYFSKILSKEETNCKTVYDIQIENDHSYLTSNGIVHNSVGGSLIGYLLDIHSADPIKYNLIFARFHNREKTSMPDIDLDFSPSGRSKVQNYIRQKYGDEYVAHVSNVNTITPKVYVRDLSRTFEFGDAGRSEAAKIGNDIADTIPADIKKLDKALEEDTVPLFAAWTEQHPELKEFIGIISGKARAWSTHAAGLVIGNRPLADIVPVRRDKDGSFALEYDKDRAEDNGLVKMDTLGLQTLDIIDDTHKLIAENNKPLPPDPPQLDDKKTYDLISEGNTFCVFQLATTATHLCKAVKPSTLEEISYINALVRPSAKNIVNDFIETKEGKKEVQLMHPNLQRAFGATYGFGLFEESLFFLAQDIAGWDLHSADRLRKLTKEKGKNPEKVKQWREEFINDAVKNKNIEKEIATKIWDEVINGFNGYGFNSSHSILYSMISYHTAYLKAHYPLEFLVANLMTEVNSNNAKVAKDNILRIKSEIRSLGVRIVAPNLNTSGISYKIIDDKTLMTGLDALKYMGKDALPEILEKRPFNSFDELLSKTDGKKVRAPTIQALAACGCLDFFGLPRRLMFLYASDYRKKLQVYLKKKPEKRGGPFVYPFPDEDKNKDWSPREKYALEQYYLGEGISGTIHDRFEGFFKGENMNFTKFPDFFPYKKIKSDKKLTDEKDKEEFEKYKRKMNQHDVGYSSLPPIRGIVTRIFSFKVKKQDSKYLGQEMARITLEDPYGNELSIVAFPNEWYHIQNRLKDFGEKKDKFQPGIALSITGVFQYENEHTYSFIINDILDYKASPALPEDLKAKKVKMPRVKKSDIKVAEMTKEELAEEVEDEFVEDGIYTDDEEFEFDDPFK